MMYDTSIDFRRATVLSLYLQHVFSTSQGYAAILTVFPTFSGLPLPRFLSSPSHIPCTPLDTVALGETAPPSRSSSQMTRALSKDGITICGATLCWSLTLWRHPPTKRCFVGELRNILREHRYSHLRTTESVCVK